MNNCGGFLIPKEWVKPLRKLLREIEEDEAMKLEEREKKFFEKVVNRGSKIRIPYLEVSKRKKEIEENKNLLEYLICVDGDDYLLPELLDYIEDTKGESDG